MWPFDNRRGVRKLTPYRAYCRGRVRPTLSEAEVERYFAADIQILTAFVLGSIASETEGEPLPTEVEVEQQVKARLGYPYPKQTGPTVVEVVVGKGRGDGSPPPVPAVTWIGEPLPAAAGGGA